MTSRTILLPTLAAMLMAGCATGPDGRVHQTPVDPSQWRVVSVTPVPAGTAARVAAASPDGKAVELSSRPVPLPPPASAPYHPAPLYAPPYIEQPAYYWPPISLSLGFVFGRHWSGGRYRHR